MSDEALAGARAGSVAAFATLVRAHERQVFSLALRMLGRRDEAEDLAQEIFMQLYDNLANITSPQHVTHWLRRVTAHRAIDQLRKRGVLRQVAIDDVPELAAAATDIESVGDPFLQRQLQALLLELNPSARAVVTLRYQEDLEPIEIGKLLDMPINTVKSHLKRSLDLLREKMNVSA